MEAAEAIKAALGEVPGIRVYTDLGAVVDPPGVVIGPPRLLWETQESDPTSAEFLIYAVVASDGRSIERMWGLASIVAPALDTVPTAVVKRADPGSFAVGTTSLPAYEIYVEMSL